MSDNKELNQYQRLSPETRKRNIEYSNKYNREHATRITIKVKNENFSDIQLYMDNAIADGKAKSKNDFIIQCLRYCVDGNVFGIKKGIDEKSE